MEPRVEVAEWKEERAAQGEKLEDVAGKAGMEEELVDLA